MRASADIADTATFRAVFLGPPGAGKGTQAASLVDSAAVLHISTGDMLREHVGQGSELGTQAKSFMDDGRLVPDDLIIAMVEERLARDNTGPRWILDGFPRTVAQAEALERSLTGGLGLTHVVYFAVPSEVLIDRLTARSTCSGCGTIWNRISKPPAEDGVCDRCGGELTQRADDRPEAVGKRLEVYNSQTEPLLGFYRTRGLLTEVDADRSPDNVFQDLVAALDREVT